MSANRELFHEVTRFETELWNAVDARLRAEVDTPLGRYEALRIIDSVQDCRVIDVAETLAITMGGASKLVDRVEAAGLCDRRSNPADGRSTFLALTAAGRELLGRAVTVVDAELERRIAPALSAADVAGLLASMKTLRAAGHAIDHSERRR